MKLKLKIMKTRPEVSDEELRAYMDFDALLERRKAALKKAGRLNMLRNGAILLATGVLLAVVWFTHRGDQAVTPQGPNAPEQNTPEAQPSQVLPPDTTTIAQETENANNTNSTSENLTAEPHQPEATLPEPADKKPEAETTDTNNYVYTEAAPVDGFPALYEYFNRELVYPTSAIPDSIQGVVTVNFVIGTDGSPENIQIQNSLGAAFDDEVRRLIRNMPAWKPAAVNGNPVPSKLAIPITFRLEKVR